MLFQGILLLCIYCIQCNEIINDINDQSCHVTSRSNHHSNTLLNDNDNDNDSTDLSHDIPFNTIKQDTLSPLIYISNGSYFMGTNSFISYPRDFEGPQRLVTITNDFYIEQYEVTNTQYAEFVQDTNYITDSERFEWSFVFHSAIPTLLKDQITQAVADASWWLPVNNSNWLYPEGKLETIHTNGSKTYNDVFSTGRAEYPVIHISWTDANKYCKWKYNKEPKSHDPLDAASTTNEYEYSHNLGRLPTEAEWEYAARGPEGRLSDDVLSDIQHHVYVNTSIYEQKYPWGNKILATTTATTSNTNTDNMNAKKTKKYVYQANYYQGKFPQTNTKLDGYAF